MKTIKTTYIRSAFLLAVIVMMIFSSACQKKNPLSSWTDNAQAKNDLMDYLAVISKEGSENYIPVEDRIAVFDLDGTLMCETYPRCFEYMVFVDYVLNNQDYTPSDEVRAVAQEIVDTKWQENPLYRLRYLSIAEITIFAGNDLQNIWNGSAIPSSIPPQ